MSRENSIQIITVSLESPLFVAVVALHAARKSRLGQFPVGAFEEHAKRKLILAAVTPEGAVAGYVLYRIATSKNRAAIVHLTTADSFRGQGIPRMLVDMVKSETRHLNGIMVSCRRDYGLSDMWRAFGFTPRHSKEGRGADGALLDCWWFSHNQNDLFSFAAAQDVQDSRLIAAIDANIFYDLTCPNRPQGEDTKVLQADWLHDVLVLCITPELYNEIHRALNEADKKRARTNAQGFRELKTDEQRVREIEQELKPLFNGGRLNRDISDSRQVAHAIAAEVHFLITRDGPMLERADAILDKYGLHVLHPTSLVNHIDHLQREAEYRPARLEGSRWRQQLVTADDVEGLVERFKHPHKERASEFKKKIRHYLAFPQQWSSRLIIDNSQNIAVYLVRGVAQPGLMEIPVVRHSDHPLAGTLLRHALHEIGLYPREGTLQINSVTEPELSDVAKGALMELGFIASENAWLKVSKRGVLSRETFLSQLNDAGLPDCIKDQITRLELAPQSVWDQGCRSKIELLFSPVKIVSSETPCFIVSIRPDWAAHFFDIPVGGQILMDLNEKLHLGIEGAYYCSSKNKHIEAPGRVLWYVSKGPSGSGSMAVKACSSLEERVIGTPKELFARFRHLGVYAWKHVLETAGAKEKTLMAFRFTRTERFLQEVPLSTLQKLEIPQPQNPRHITEEQFAAIYRIGMKL